MQESIVPTKDDVLLGRGQATISHPGNVIFREEVDKQRGTFSSAKRFLKRGIAESIVNSMKSRGVRFLVEGGSANKNERTSKVWIIADDEKVIEKVMHRLRIKDTAVASDQLRQEDFDSSGRPNSPEIASLLEPIANFRNEELAQPTDLHLGPLMNLLDTQVSLRSWIGTNYPVDSMESMSRYIEKALAVAIRITECSPGDNTLSNLDCDNIIVVSSDGDELAVTFRLDSEEQQAPEITRLALLGYVFYEIFSGRRLLWKPSSAPSISHVGFERLERNSPSKRQFPSSNALDVNSDLAKEMNEIRHLPSRLFSLVQNLLECADGDFMSDEAYRSIADLLDDLRLMESNPTCYLYDLNVPGAMPTLTIPDKLYGRDDVIAKMSFLYLNQRNCRGLICQGNAGVGKTRLLQQCLTDLAAQTASHLAITKFDQGNSNPLANITKVFDELVIRFASETDPDRLNQFQDDLRDALGEQISFLASLVPSLSMILPHAPTHATKCIDRTESVTYMLGKLLEIISSHQSIIIMLDDIQFADINSRLIISSLVLRSVSNPHIFFVICLREESVQALATWLGGVQSCHLELIRLGPLDVDSVNTLVSETVHHPPRLTRHLSHILFAKTGGNILFLRLLLRQLSHSGLIQLKLNPSRWAWSVEKIADVEMPDNVVLLLIKDMTALSADLLLCLQALSCMGSLVLYPALDVISADLVGVDLKASLQELTRRGMLMDTNEHIRFSHDKFHQAAYQTMTSEQQSAFHKTFGLALSQFALGQHKLNDEVFFCAVNQINRAALPSGPRALLGDIEIVAQLNLKAGSRSEELSDKASALNFYQFGIDNVNSVGLDQRWGVSLYEVALKLHTAAVETACALNDAATVMKLSKEVVDNSKSVEDKLACLFSVSISLMTIGKYEESKDVAFDILRQCNERLPLREAGDEQLAGDIAMMVGRVSGMTDEAFFLLQESPTSRKDDITIGVYVAMTYVLAKFAPQQVLAAKLRMLEITLNNGICARTPIAVGHFGHVCLAVGEYELAQRLAKLSLRLIEIADAAELTARVIAIVGTISFAAEPFQLVADSLMHGYTVGQQVGDVFASGTAAFLSTRMSFISGRSLCDCYEKFIRIAKGIVLRKQKFIFWGAASYASSIRVLMDGREELLDENLPTWSKIVVHLKQEENRQVLDHIMHNMLIVYMRIVFYTRNISDDDDIRGNDSALPKNRMMDTIEAIALRWAVVPGEICIVAVFYEALAYYIGGNVARGKKGTPFIKKWSQICPANFENKYMLLQALSLESDDAPQAEKCYLRSIQLARDQRFKHEEGICSELAGYFYHKRGEMDRSTAFLSHAVRCYREWGSEMAVTRLEAEAKAIGLTITPQPLSGLLIESFLVKETSRIRARDVS